MDESESKSYIDNQGAIGRPGHPNGGIGRAVKEDESKHHGKIDSLLLADTGQNFFQANEYHKGSGDLLKFEEEKEAHGNDPYLNKISELDSLYPGTANQNVKVNQE